MNSEHRRGTAGMNKRLAILTTIVVAIACMGAAITRIDFVPLAPVRLVKPSGQAFGYGYGALTDASRGTALLAAQTAASSGDTIFCYSDCTISTPIGKNGVRYWFAPVTITASGTSECISDDNVDDAASDDGTTMTFDIDGQAEFRSTNAQCIDLNASGTVARIHGRRVYADGLSKAGAYVKTGATCYLTMSQSIESDDYDAMWISGGSMYFDTKFVRGGQDALEFGTGAPVVNGRAFSMVAGVNNWNGSTTVYAINADGGTGNITVDELEGRSPTTKVAINRTHYVGLSDAGTLTVTAKTIRGRVLSMGTGLRVINARITDIPSGLAGVAGGDLFGDVGSLTLQDVSIESGSGATYSVSKEVIAAGTPTLSIVGTFAATPEAIQSGITTTRIGTAADSVKLGGTTPTAAGLTLIDDADAAAQRTTLGLGTMATQAASGVAITGGSISGATLSASAITLGTSGILQGGTNTVELRNGTNAQTFNVYNTYTDGSNYERGAMRWASNVLRIEPLAAGTGTLRPMELNAGTYMNFNVAGANKFGVGGNTVVNYVGVQFSYTTSSAASLTMSAAYNVYSFTGTTATWTLPAVGNTGMVVWIKNRGSGTLTVQRASSENIYTTSSVTSFTVAAGASATLFSDGTYWNVL